LASGMSTILKDPVWKHTRRKMYFIGKDSTVAEAAKIMRSEHVGSVLVQDGPKVLGIITQRDLINKVVADGKNPAEVKASSVMSSPLITVDKNDSLDRAMTLMQENDIRRVVVLDKDGKPYGILVELRECGDLLDRQFRKGEERAKSWIEELIEDVTDHQLEHSPEA
jgi:CBS domain-containing protein